MSYILQALKKAQAERELGHVPDLSAQLTPATTTDDGDASPRRGGPWIVGAIAVLLVAAGVAAWVLFRSAPTAPAPIAAVTPASPAVTPAPTASLGPAPAAVPSISPGASAAASAAATAPLPAAPRPVVAAARASAPASAALPVRIPTLEELPAPVRSALPALAIGGSIYAQRPADRMLIVNGQVLYEGDAAAPGVTLVSIGVKSAVLRYRQQEFSLRY